MNNNILIVAPKRSGKSTNLNMLKSFFEIAVDKNGQPRNPKESANYELFSERNLKIFSSEKLLFHKHFGMFPVIFIDYGVFSEINSFTSAVESFKEILLNCFEQHEYLIHSGKLWSNQDEKNLFMRYSGCPGIFSLNEDELKNGFMFLSRLLFKHFNRRVIVLVDDYDAFKDSSSLKDHSDWDKVLAFIKEVNSRLLLRNDCLDRVLITGTLRQDISTPPVHAVVLPNNIVEYNFCKYNCFCEYYGVTMNELDELLSKFLTNNLQREKVKSNIIMQSTTLEQNNQIYNTWSVLHYLANFNISAI
ncbi:hypothetical protein J6590_060005 [Homalodisca vitripennis]|nr:hypothetical protein J6590_060002 [Homalodisca vitripennis]KAG8335787.1 hypothetical protein J6590_060005 [Homalodisca vitripennis]